MKLAIVFTGAVRECIKSIRRNIVEFTDCFNAYNPEIIFSSWLPTKEVFMYYGINYANDYDLDILREQTKGIVHTEILLKQDLTTYYRNNGHKGPITLLHRLREVAKYLKKENKTYDYIVLSRHDNQVKMQNVEKYFQNEIFIAPLYWNANLKYSTTDISDHLFIMPYSTFIKILDIPEETIIDMCQRSFDDEQFAANLIKYIGDIRFIEDNDILTFINRNMSCRHWKIT